MYRRIHHLRMDMCTSYCRYNLYASVNLRKTMAKMLPGCIYKCITCSISKSCARPAPMSSKLSLNLSENRSSAVQLQLFFHAGFGPSKIWKIVADGEMGSRLGWLSMARTDLHAVLCWWVGYGFLRPRLSKWPKQLTPESVPPCPVETHKSYTELLATIWSFVRTGTIKWNTLKAGSRIWISWAWIISIVAIV